MRRSSSCVRRLSLWTVGAAAAGAGAGLVAAPTPALEATADGDWHRPGDGSVAFVASGGDGSFTASTRNGAARLMRDGMLVRPRPGSSGRVLETTFRGARTGVAPSGEDELPGVVNILRDRDPVAWVRGAKRHGRVRWDDVWPGVDVVCVGDGGRLRYDFVVAPDADARSVALEVRGADDVSVDADGRLVVVTGDDRTVHGAPVAFESDGRAREPVAARFHVEHEGDVAVVSFDVPGRRAGRALVIDPTVEFLSWLGGAEGDEAHGLWVGLDGTRWVAGVTASANFPAPGGTVATAGDYDLFVSRIAPDGTLEWTTLIGGAGTEQCAGVVVDPRTLEPIVGGSSTSTLYPVSAGAYQTVFGGIGPGDGQFDFGDAVVTKLAADGASVVWSTYVGGRYGEMSHDLALGPDGGVVICGRTDSANFPLVNPVMQRPGHYSDGPADAFATRLGPDGSVVFSTYFGGAKPVPQSHGGTSYEAIEHFMGAAFDKSGNIWFAGWSNSDDLPVTVAQPISGVNVKGVTVNGVRAVRPDAGNADHDAFVCRLSGKGRKLLFSRFLGGTGGDYANDVALDTAGNIHITGQTWSTAATGFPVTANAYRPESAGTLNDAFVQVISANGKKHLYGTFLGGSSSENGTDDGRIAVDLQGRIHVTGITSSQDFPLTDDATDLEIRSFEAFVTTFPPLGKGPPVFSTYLGARFTDSGEAIAMDLSGRLHVVGHTLSMDLAVTESRLQTAYGGSGEIGVGDALVATYDFGDTAAAGGGALAFPKKLNFGKAAVGARAMKVLALANRSRTKSVAVVLTPPAESPFALAARPGPVSLVVPAGRTALVPLVFAPTTTGKLSASLGLTADGTAEAVALSGTGK